MRPNLRWNFYLTYSDSKLYPIKFSRTVMDGRGNYAKFQTKVNTLLIAWGCDWQVKYDLPFEDTVWILPYDTQAKYVLVHSASSFLPSTSMVKFLNEGSSQIILRSNWLPQPCHCFRKSTWWIHAPEFRIDHQKEEFRRILWITICDGSIVRTLRHIQPHKSPNQVR